MGECGGPRPYPVKQGPRAGPPRCQLGEGASGRWGGAAGGPRGSGEDRARSFSSAEGARSFLSSGEGLTEVGGGRGPQNQGAGGPNSAPKLGPAAVAPLPRPCTLAGADSLFAPSLPLPLLHPRKRGSLERVKFWVKNGQRVRGTT